MEENNSDKRQAGQNVYTLGELADLLDLTLDGDPDRNVSGIATLASASPTTISFYHNEKFFPDLKNTKAGAVILSVDAARECPANKLLSDNPYLAYARLSRLFENREGRDSGIHPSAVIASDAAIGKDVSIGPNTVIESGVTLGDGCVVGANCVIGKNSALGNECLLYSGISIYHGIHIGKRAIIHANVVIGSDGFGFAGDGHKQVKIAQLGGVCIGDDVEIGAGSTIDRGALEDTEIGDGVKLDNQVQIAHNVKVGENTVICGCSAVAGSSTIGKNCIIAGAVGIINHVTIADGVTITAMSLVNKSITRKGIYSSGTGLSETGLWKKNIVHFRHLDKLNSRLKALEKGSANDKKPW